MAKWRSRKPKKAEILNTMQQDSSGEDDNLQRLNRLSEDIYTYIIRLAPLLLCLGFVLSLIQKTVRFAYYKVDHLYLMELRTEEVLQGLSYLFVFIYCLFLWNDVRIYHNKYKKSNMKFIFVHMLMLSLYTAFLWYTQTYYMTLWHGMSIVGILCVFGVLFKVVNLSFIIGEYTFLRTNVCFIIFILMAAVIVIQYTVESANKRFTYIKSGIDEFIIVSTFKEYYITALSDVAGDTIRIYRGQIALFKLDNQIYAQEFSRKIME